MALAWSEYESWSCGSVDLAVDNDAICRARPSTISLTSLIPEVDSPIWTSFTPLILLVFLSDRLRCWELSACRWKNSQISDALFDISSPPLVAISHSCTFGSNPSKKYWHWCHFSYPWCGHFKSSPLNRSHVSKNCSSSLWVNSEISLRIALVLCTGKYLFKNFVTICSHDAMLLAGNVLSHERALSFKENGNSLSLTSSSEKFSYLNVWQMAWKSFKWLYGSSFSRP